MKRLSVERTISKSWEKEAEAMLGIAKRVLEAVQSGIPNLRPPDEPAA